MAARIQGSGQTLSVNGSLTARRNAEVDRRVAAGLYEAWRRGARLDSWRECFRPQIWWQAFRDLGIDVDFYTHRQRPIGERLPWDHINVKKGRAYLEKEQERSVIQLRVMADAT